MPRRLSGDRTASVPGVVLVREAVVDASIPKASLVAFMNEILDFKTTERDTFDAIREYRRRLRALRRWRRSFGQLFEPAFKDLFRETACVATRFAPSDLFAVGDEDETRIEAGPPILLLSDTSIKGRKAEILSLSHSDANVADPLDRQPSGTICGRLLSYS